LRQASAANNVQFTCILRQAEIIRLTKEHRGIDFVTQFLPVPEEIFRHRLAGISINPEVVVGQARWHAVSSLDLNYLFSALQREGDADRIVNARVVAIEKPADNHLSSIAVEKKSN
jgi:hypothetical protein